MSAKRTRWEMPEDIRDLLIQNQLVETYQARPPYQRNDYIGWINRAKKDETRHKRINQMIAELKQGDVYMKMQWKSREN